VPRDSDTTLSIGEVAERTGMSVHALRFYEREGLIAEPIERVGGRRVYTEEHLEWLEVCRFLRASGMPLSALRTYTDLVRAGDGNERQRLELLREHQDRISMQMSQLSRSAELIAHKVGVYEDIIDNGTPGRDCRAPPRR
jgi:DNA-binding transcriptional MerR regulator